MGAGHKVAVITGASHGIGAALVSAYRERDYQVVATARSIPPSADPGLEGASFVTGEILHVDVGPTGNAFAIAARLNISLPGMERDVAQRVVDTAHEVCPYSRATRGNVDVVITLL